MARQKNPRGDVEESVELDGHRFKLETWGGRNRAAIAVVAVMLPLFLLIQLTTDADMPFWMFALIGVWVGLPSAYELVVQERGLRIGTTENALGRLTRLFAADPLADLRGRYQSGDGVMIPWEAIDAVEASGPSPNQRRLDLVVRGVPVSLAFAIRNSHMQSFGRMFEQVKQRSARSLPAEVPDEVLRLRGQAQVVER
ncbi:MAG: hypothetical protein KC912_18350 [Proteobacteria bacterium]|nr:hypothetical protein [Pseudomonadota bacterium]